MQFGSVIALLSLAAAASASPANLEARTTPSQEVQQKCSAGFKASCCNTTTKNPLLALVNLVVGVDCVALNCKY